MIKIKHSQAFVFIVVVLSIFIIGLTWVVLSKPLAIVYDVTINASEVQSNDMQTFFIRAKTVWNYILIIAAIVLFIWAYMKAQEQTGTGYN